MRVLIIGSGGREHAIGHALAASSRHPDLVFAPGNAGTEAIGTNVPIGPDDQDLLLQYAIDNDVDLTIVGPEVPLVHGIVDLFEAEGRAIVGPTASAARLEGSKAFAKSFMDRYDIPTAAHRTFARTQYEEALTYIREQGAPLVLKASGLAAGKGAIVCQTDREAEDALDAILRDDGFGQAGDEIVIEEFMDGEEASVFVVTDGTSHQVLLPAQDHKQIGDGDTGPNTGGMGAYAPAPMMTDRLMEQVNEQIVEATLDGMREDGHPYRGILYVGLMITAAGPKVVEYNCRLGDPEAQVVLPMMSNDALELFEHVAAGTLAELSIENRAGSAATVVLASGGYPGAYQKGHVISGIDAAAQLPGVIVFHAGTRKDADGHVVTSGGRVLAVTASASTLQQAVERAYEAANLIDFEGKYFRQDIGHKGLARVA